MRAGQEEDRRSFLKKAGTVAWAAPMILTLTAKQAGALAVSCAPTGTPCGFFSEADGECFGASVICCHPCQAGVGAADGDPCSCS